MELAKALSTCVASGTGVGASLSVSRMKASEERRFTG
jgi:hypothetical protein